MSLLLALVVGCNKDGPIGTRGDGPGEDQTNQPSTVDGFLAFEPAPAMIYRITDTEWRNSVEDLFGVRYDGSLPVDYLLYNYSRVGGSELTIPPLDLELYEGAGWAVAAVVV